MRRQGARRTVKGSRAKLFARFDRTEALELADQPALSVVGSIILRTSVIFVAGKPLISACFRMMPLSLAR